jgi:chromosome segregation ATPase
LEDLLNNYHELLGIIETIVIGEKSEVNEVLRELKKRIEDFLASYDKDKNRMVDMEELKSKEGKNKLTQDLNDKENNQLQKIIKAIEKVKEEVIKYHRRNEKDEVSTESENQETKLYQQIEKKLKEIREKELVEQQNSLEFKLKKAEINYQQLENRLTKEKEDLRLLKKSKKLTNEEENLLNSKIKKLEQDLSETKKEIDNLKNEPYKT